MIKKIGGHACPTLTGCSIECKHGRMTSMSGCELCECIDPCENVKCEANQVCVLENSTPICRLSNYQFLDNLTSLPFDLQ